MTRINAKGNLFENIPAEIQEEIFQDLFEKSGVRIERIVSKGQASPDFGWYDQDWDEWVVLFSGSAELEFHCGERMQLCPGDYVYIPAGNKHRVLHTAEDSESVWLAVHLP